MVIILKLPIVKLERTSIGIGMVTDHDSFFFYFVEDELHEMIGEITKWIAEDQDFLVKRWNERDNPKKMRNY